MTRTGAGYQISKITPSGALLPARIYLLKDHSLPRQHHSLGQSIQTYDPMEGILHSKYNRQFRVGFITMVIHGQRLERHQLFIHYDI